MEVTIKLEGIDAALKMFDPKQVERAARATLNKVARSAKTAASDLIRNELGMNIRKSDLDSHITINPAYGSSLRAELIVKGSPLMLTYFNAKQGSIYVAKNKGGAGKFGIAQKLKGKHGTGPVQVTIIKGKTTTLNNHTFIAQGRGGVPVVFYRRASGKLAARKVYAETSMFKKPKVFEVVKAKIYEQWGREWTNQIRQLSSGQGWMTQE